MYLGIDLGGTNLKAGVLDENGDLAFQFARPTDAESGPDALIGDLRSIIESVISRNRNVKSAGLGVPGVVTDDGVVKIAPNLKGWKNIALKETLAGFFDIPISIDNDANTAALAELELGAGKNEQYFIYVTLGTGVGGAIIYERKLFRGQYGGAGEIGHLIIDCYDQSKGRTFRNGVLEEFTGRTKIIDIGREILKKYPDSILHQKKFPDPYFVSEACKQNDEAARKIFEKIGFYLGIGLASAMNLLDIRLIIVGGGISQAHDILFNSTLETIKERALPALAEGAEIRKAEFTKDAGIIGAALLGRQALNSDN